jgi:pyruvate/2-oxoglutarate/acetoin dehydrogenase E1 component
MPASREITLKEAILEALCEEMRLDSSVFYIGEDVGEAGGVFKQTEGLLDAFGSARVIDTPISEPAIMGMAIGAAMSGSRPVTEIMFGDFITLAMDSLVNQAAKVSYMSAGGFSVPLVLRTAVGIGGALGPQHSQSLHAWVSHIPGLKVVLPSTAADAKGLLKSAIRDNNPVVFFEDRMTYNQKGTVPEGEFTVPLGVADVKRKGQDVTIIAVSRMVGVAIAAAEQLEEMGISAEVVDPRTIAPLDTTTLVNSVKKTSRALVVDGGHKLYGITGEIAAVINEQAFDYLDAPVMRLAAPQVPISANKTLESLMLPSVEQIIQTVQKMFRVNMDSATV